jgi:hypothetical protein
MAGLKEGPDTTQAHGDCCAGRDAIQGERLAKPEGKWVGGKGPRIELLYFDGCPTYELVRQIVEELLRETGGRAEIRTTKVASDAQARQLKFIGSPTLRIDGRDVDPVPETAAQYGLKCRVYATDGGLVAYPPREMVLAALKEAGYVA